MALETATVELEIPPRSPYVGVVRLALSSLGRSAGLDADAIDDLKIAVSEACATAVLNSEGSDSKETITVVWREERARLVVEVWDGTDARDQSHLQATDSAGYSTRSIMSRALLESLVDTCEIEPRDPGTVTRLTVRRPIA